MQLNTLHTDNIRKIYDFTAPLYEKLFKIFFYPRQQHVISTMNIKPNHKILDLGVGTGLSLPLYPEYCDVVGIDLSKDMLNRAQEKVDTFGLQNITLREMNAEFLEFEDNYFDSVVATFVISVVSDPVKVISEMKRVCKKDGQLIIVNHFKSRNPILARLEKLINPFTCKIGWRSDVCLTDLVRKADLDIDQHYKIKKVDFWNIIFLSNNKVH